MAPKITQAPTVERVEVVRETQSQNGQLNGQDSAWSTPQVLAYRVNLPTFPEESGWREITDPENGTCTRVPLTLLDILFSTEDDMGVVVMPQSIAHDSLTRGLTTMIENHLGEGWLTMQDVFVYWPYPNTPPTAPDITAILGGERSNVRGKSYFVGQDGPLPTFVVEITSRETRQADLNHKPTYYAAMGIKEVLIIDIETKAPDDWQLIGYRLEGSPYPQPIEPDADGGLTFETVGLRFVAEGRGRVDVYDSATGQRLLTSEEQIKQKEEAKQRADNAEQRADNAEQRAERYAAMLRKLGIDVDEKE